MGNHTHIVAVIMSVLQARQCLCRLTVKMVDLPIFMPLLYIVYMIYSHLTSQLPLVLYVQVGSFSKHISSH